MQNHLLHSPPSAVTPLRAWLALGLTALLLATGAAILLVLLRLPLLANHPALVAQFRTALVLHVDLAATVWLLAWLGIFHAWIAPATRWSHNAVYLGWGGLTLMVLSPFVGHGVPIMSNYLPLLIDPLFLTGLTAYGLSALLAGLGLLFMARTHHEPQRTILLALRLAGAATLLAALTFAASYATLPKELEGIDYFEPLVWGGGHLLQWVHVQVVLASWLWLAQVSGTMNFPHYRWLRLAFWLGALPLLAVPWAYLSGDWASYRLFFTQFMSYGSWLVIPCVMVSLAWSAPATQPSVLRPYLWLSVAILGGGLLLGAVINGDTLTVTAHYHGTVGAATLTYMGMCHHLLTTLGHGRAENRWSRLLPFLYASGLAGLMAGLSWWGLAGGPRKTPFAVHGPLDWNDSLALLLAGVGGLIALLALLLFLARSFACLWPRAERLNYETLNHRKAAP